MVESNKFEAMGQQALEDRMLHHLQNGIEEQNAERVRGAHTGWFRRLDEIYFRRFGLHGLDALIAPEFRKRHGLDVPLEVKIS